MDKVISDVLAVEPAEGFDQFVGHSGQYGAIGVYGGHFVGQCLAAALATVEEPKLTHSLHCYFLRPGDVEAPIHYQVSRLREGKGSDVRSVTASQHGKAVFHMTASFKLLENGDEHQPEMPEVTPPEALLAENTKGASFNPPPTTGGMSEMVLASQHFMQEEFTPGREPSLQVWTRCHLPEDATERDTQIALAFISDGTLMFNAAIPHGLPFRTHRLTSIDHAAWFHRPCNARDWMLFDQHSSAAADGRGMNHGTLFARDGTLLMTMAQESMLRRI